jgi:hypothetical protein
MAVWIAAAACDALTLATLERFSVMVALPGHRAVV